VDDDDRLLLEHGRTVVVLEGGAVRTLLPALLPLLDGSRTLDELTAALGEPTRQAVQLTLDVLATHDLLLDGPEPSETRAGARVLAATYGLEPALADERLRSGSVGIVGSGAAGPRIARLLQADGVGEVKPFGWDEGGADLAIVVPGRDEACALAGWNRHALEVAIPWFALRPFDGLVATIGPLVVPGESCCHECLQLRLAANLEYGADLGRIEAVPVVATGSAGVEAVAAGLAAHLALCWIGDRDPRLPGAMFVLETRPGPRLEAHPVLRVPRCPACSPASRTTSRLPWHEAAA
jgi:bacteriocin biosynthesis cyclodehydratase domain-containing protein